MKIRKIRLITLPVVEEKISPINNIVDVTNYVLHDLGQPLHAFDYDRLASKNILVRRAATDEKLETLDSETRQLTKEAIVITNGKDPVALAGIMGGLGTEIQDGTVTIALESALFEPVAIRKTAKELNLRSESSSRYEKGINHDTILSASAHAAALIVELAGGTVVSGAAVASDLDVKNVVVTITLEKLNRSLGTDIKSDEVVSIFKTLSRRSRVISSD